MTTTTTTAGPVTRDEPLAYCGPAPMPARATLVDLVNALSRHHGVDRGISAARLARQLRLSRRALRLLISEGREQGMAICGHPSSGYFMARTPDELAVTCEFLTGRALHSLRAVSRLQRVALPTLLGQLMLNQA